MGHAQQKIEPVICPYCDKPAELVDSSVIYGPFKPDFGKFWHCSPCDAYVGTHRNSPRHAPLGRLANKTLRHWKMRAHAAFDPLWKSGRMTRVRAYDWMARRLEIPKEKAHIGKFDVEQCQKLVELMETLNNNV